MRVGHLVKCVRENRWPTEEDANVGSEDRQGVSLLSEYNLLLSFHVYFGKVQCFMV